MKCLRDSRHEGKLEGSVGDDVFDGGAGSDTTVYGAANNIIRLAVSGPQQTGEGSDTLIAIENFNVSSNASASASASASAGDDAISGNSLRNTLNGGLGRNILDGEGGRDWLIGGADTFWIRSRALKTAAGS